MDIKQAGMGFLSRYLKAIGICAVLGIIILSVAIFMIGKTLQDAISAAGAPGTSDASQHH